MSLRLPSPRDIGLIVLQLVLVAPLIVYVYVRQVIGGAIRREARARDFRRGKRHPVNPQGRADARTSTESPGPSSASPAPSAEGRLS